MTTPWGGAAWPGPDRRGNRRPGAGRPGGIRGGLPLVYPAFARRLPRVCPPINRCRGLTRTPAHPTPFTAPVATRPRPRHGLRGGAAPGLGWLGPPGAHKKTCESLITTHHH